jgi:predicted phage terminase large subunit-like protein
VRPIIHTKENLQLLAKYLAKKFGKDKAKQLIEESQRKSHETKHDYLFGPNSLAHELGRRDLEFFCMFYLQDTFVPKPDNLARTLSPTHLECWNLLQDCVIKDTFDRLILCLPRGFAKTTLTTFATSIHQVCYGAFFQVIIGKTESDAQEFIFEVRKQFEENPYIQYTFGELIDTKRFTVNKNEIHFANNCKVLALSSTSSIRGKKHMGKRPTHVYLDDTQGIADVLTDEAKRKKMEVYQKDILFAGDEPVVRNGKKVKAGTKFIISGTVLAADCFISTLLKDPQYKSIVGRAILVDDIDKMFNNEYWRRFKEIYYDHKNQYAEAEAKSFYYDNEAEMKFPVLWEDKWHPLELAIKYFSDPVAMKQEMMNDASILTGSKCFFNIKKIKRNEMEQLEFEKTMITVDCAVEIGERNDFSAVCLGSKTNTGHRYVRKGLIYKKEFDDSVATVLDLLREYEDVSHVLIEKNTFQGRYEAELKKLIDADPQLRKRYILVTEKRQFSNKENRIRSISGKVNNGFIIFCEEDEDFTAQILDYQGSKVGHDDAIDSVEVFDANIDQIDTIRPIKLYDRSSVGL